MCIIQNQFTQIETLFINNFFSPIIKTILFVSFFPNAPYLISTLVKHYGLTHGRLNNFLANEGINQFDDIMEKIRIDYEDILPKMRQQNRHKFDSNQEIVPPKTKKSSNVEEEKIVQKTVNTSCKICNGIFKSIENLNEHLGSNHFSSEEELSLYNFLVVNKKPEKGMIDFTLNLNNLRKYINNTRINLHMCGGWGRQVW